MPSLIVTPPEIVKEPGTYLLVNIEPNDLEMVLRWLQINGHDHIIHVYYEGMENFHWLAEVSAQAKKVIINTETIKNSGVVVCLTGQQSQDKFVWLGDVSGYNTAIEYFTRNDRPS